MVYQYQFPYWRQPQVPTTGPLWPVLPHLCLLPLMVFRANTHSRRCFHAQGHLHAQSGAKSSLWSFPPSPHISLYLCIHPSREAARCCSRLPCLGAAALPGSCSQSQRVGIRMLEEPRTQTGLSLFSTAPLQTVYPSLSTSQRLRARALELRACQGEGLECSVNEARARSANELVQR